MFRRLYPYYIHVREQPKASVTVATNALGNPLLMKMLTNHRVQNLPGVETEAIAVRDSSCKILQCIRATSYDTTRDGIDLKIRDLAHALFIMRESRKFPFSKYDTTLSVLSQICIKFCYSILQS